MSDKNNNKNSNNKNNNNNNKNNQNKCRNSDSHRKNNDNDNNNGKNHLTDNIWSNPIRGAHITALMRHCKPLVPLLIHHQLQLKERRLRLTGQQCVITLPYLSLSFSGFISFYFSLVLSCLSLSSSILVLDPSLTLSLSVLQELFF